MPYTPPYRYRHSNLRGISGPENSANHEKGPNDQNKERYPNCDQIEVMQEWF